MRNRFWPALAALALAACASVDTELREARESWRGATYDELVAAWGAPSQSAVDSHTWLSGPPPIQGTGGGTGGVLFGPPDGKTGRCDRTLVFRNGRVADERWTGDPAACKQFVRRK